MCDFIQKHLLMGQLVAATILFSANENFLAEEVVVQPYNQAHIPRWSV